LIVGRGHVGKTRVGDVLRMDVDEAVGFFAALPNRRLPEVRGERLAVACLHGRDDCEKSYHAIARRGRLVLDTYRRTLHCARPACLVNARGRAKTPRNEGLPNSRGGGDSRLWAHRPNRRGEALPPRGRRTRAFEENRKMKKTRNSRAALLCAGALFAAAGTAQAALQDRDLDGDSVIDAFYDTELDITWLRNANVNGAMDWDSAVAWADDFSFAGYDDWRLPTTLQPDPSCTEQSGASYGYDCTGSEMGHLWYVELGNTAGAMTNTGDFQNLQPLYYWSGTEYALDPSMAWYFLTDNGLQNVISKSFDTNFYALAVRPGDVPVIPEPQTYALMLAGLTALWVARRRAR